MEWLAAPAKYVVEALDHFVAAARLLQSLAVDHNPTQQAEHCSDARKCCSSQPKSTAELVGRLSMKVPNIHAAC
jgi:hypothetical protein